MVYELLSLFLHVRSFRSYNFCKCHFHVFSCSWCTIFVSQIFIRSFRLPCEPYCLDDLTEHKIIVSSTAKFLRQISWLIRSKNTIGSIFVPHWILGTEWMEGCLSPSSD